MDRIRKQLEDLKKRLEAARSAGDTASGMPRTLLKEQDDAFEKTCAQLRSELGEKLLLIQTDAVKARLRIEKRWKRNARRIERACEGMLSRIKADAAAFANSHQKQRETLHAPAMQEYEQKAAALKKECAAGGWSRESAIASAQKLLERIAQLAKKHRLLVHPAETTPPDGAAPETEIARRLAEAEARLDSLQKKLARRIPSGVFYFLIIAIHAGAVAYINQTMPQSPYVFAAIPTLLCMVALIHYIYSSMNERVASTASDLQQDVADCRALTEKQMDLVSQQMKQGLLKIENEKIQRICAVDVELERHEKSAGAAAEAARADVEARRAGLNQKIAKRKTDDLEKIDNDSDSAAKNLRAHYVRKLTHCADLDAARRKAIEEASRNEVAHQASEWDQALAGFHAFATEELRRCRVNNPVWSALAEPGWRLPTSFAEEVHAGNFTIDLKRFIPLSNSQGRFAIPDGSTVTLPLILSFPMNGSLFIRTGAENRDAALKLLFATVLRILSSFPPAKAKLTVVDPVGLGQNFAALMHLADYDETLVSGKIWSDTGNIERKLGELTEHMEKVIQKYLRNRYASISEYNKEAGELAEPYRILVVADFPSGFSDLALERLASIVESGVRCGVYTLILYDDWIKLPALMSQKQLKKNGSILADAGGEFFVDDEALTQGVFTPEAPPSTQQIDVLVNSIGKQCKQAALVQVPFEAVAPKAGEIWSASAAQEIRLPLGKAGADRLQYLNLCRGTAQHALLAGKTGSGKSNLFHVVITNAALWYSPREIEFYLIDLKKGVEFKTYGIHRLPHARVVAIESDREFGLSVLRRIDRELSERGELFRKAGVQDFPSYRKSAHGGEMRRTLLIIDEFQEFFTDDDSVAQDAALLLDRIVRQGRAFGVHVILGTQTLGGSYTLAKSTLGQVAVRIALQCTETDSYLILNDDNAAAALLSRPGEAIYNDMSGLVEGNNPFQACYMPREAQDRYLSVLQKKAADDGIKTEPPAIFEGNALADMANNRLLGELAAATPAPETSARVWLGEANAIKGPTEVAFSREAGCNLLVVGQRGNADVAMCCASILCIAAGNPPDGARIVIVDGTSPDSGAKERFALLAEALPHDIEIADYRAVPRIMRELAAGIKSRQEENSNAGKRTWLMVLGLEKFRMLRDDDDYSFTASEDEENEVPPAKAFGTIMTEGPREGIFSILWCDTLSNLNRTLSRKALREFEMRVLFQMSATDSSELIDSPAASRLGLYNALLYTMRNGAIEKFRPYALPDAELVRELGRTLLAKWPPLSPRQ